MDEINISELLDYYKERILLMITIVLTVLVLGCVYSFFFKTPLYKSTSTIAIIEKSGEGTITQSDVQLSKSLVTTYTQIIKSRKVAEKVINNLKLDYNVQTLINNITVESKADSQIITVGYIDEDSSMAASIVNDVVKVFCEEIENNAGLSNVFQWDVGEEESNPYNTNITKDLIIYLAIGIVLALVTVFIIFYFDTTIKSAEEIESKFNLPVIGIVPAVKRKEK